VRWLLIVALAVAPAGAQEMALLVTSASSVRVRAEPSVEVRVLATMPLGTELRQLDVQSGGQWVRVRTPDNVEGWVFAPLTVAAAAGGAARAKLGVAQRRVGRGGLSFAAAAEVVDLIERLAVLPAPPAGPAALALLRLRALALTVAALPGRYTLAGTPAEWARAREHMLRYNEPGGQWMLQPDFIRQERARFSDAPEAELMAWLGVEIGLPGECEGDVACYLERTLATEGAYLNEFPDGLFVSTALRRVMNRAVDWRSLAGDPRAFDRATDCARIARPLGSLRAAVAASAVPRDTPDLYRYTLHILDDISLACG
jgi:hypothetical protein